MEQNKFMLYCASLLKISKQNNIQYHCKKEYCCGLCDRYYTCLLDILKKMTEQLLKDQQERTKIED